MNNLTLTLLLMALDGEYSLRNLLETATGGVSRASAIGYIRSTDHATSVACATTNNPTFTLRVGGQEVDVTCALLLDFAKFSTANLVLQVEALDRVDPAVLKKEGSMERIHCVLLEGELEMAPLRIVSRGSGKLQIYGFGHLNAFPGVFYARSVAQIESSKCNGTLTLKGTLSPKKESLK